MKLNNCIGCGSCNAICPRNAINKVFTEHGWFKYEIDDGKCVDCGICQKICPANSVEEDLFDFNNSIKYAAYSANVESVLKSSSGGIAFEMGKVAIENGYTVIGTKYNYNKNIAEWDFCDKAEDLDKFRGSKYIQADTENIVKYILCNEGKYLVISTPCQVYGLKKAVEITNSKSEFIFVDFVCHGVPSYEMWKCYLREVSQGKIESVNFRDKTFGWHNIALKVKSEKGTSLGKRTKSSFFKAFDDGLFFNEQCYRCKLNNGKGISDIRIGDCWGEQFKENNLGVSRVLIGTKKGKDFFELIKNDIEFINIEMKLPPNNNRNFKKFQCFRDNIILQMKESNNLSKIVKKYRKTFSFKNRMFVFLRQFSLFIKIYNKLKNK